MGWTAGATVTTGDLITAAQWNSYLGAAGSLDYLKTEVDKIDDLSFDHTMTATRNKDVEYQNGSSLRLVMVGCSMDDGEVFLLKMGVGSAGTTVTAVDNGGGGNLMMNLTFIVPPNYYYELVSQAGAPARSYWAEWDIH